MDIFSGMSVEQIQEAADEILTANAPFGHRTVTPKTILVLIANLAARMKEEMNRWQICIACSVCHEKYIIQRPLAGTNVTCVCPKCHHSFSYIEGT